jgi:hypothetical protein
METILFAIFACILLLSRDRNLHIENLALRQQLAILKHKNKRQTAEDQTQGPDFLDIFIQVALRQQLAMGWPIASRP